MKSETLKQSSLIFFELNFCENNSIIKFSESLWDDAWAKTFKIFLIEFLSSFSSILTETVFSLMILKFISFKLETSINFSFETLPNSTNSVSKKDEFFCIKPSCFNPSASNIVFWWISRAIAFNPFGPWYTPYIPAIMANKACAVQIFDVAFSLLICCSLVWSAILKALFPSTSSLTPIILPGMFLL